MTSYGICNLSVIPGRIDSSDRSELLTHILFGEHFEIIDIIPKWVKIRLAHIQYECWIDEKQYAPIDKDTFVQLNNNPLSLTYDMVSTISEKANGETLSLVRGSTLPFYNGTTCRVGEKEFVVNGSIVTPKGQATRNKIIEYASLYMDAPYTWGGRSPFGMDCSGLTLMAYKLNGIFIPRDASQQAEVGTTINLLDALAGDLAYFENEEGRVVHVGLVLEGNKIIHASGRVRVDVLDEKGIFNMTTQRYSHKLCKVKRVLG